MTGEICEKRQKVMLGDGRPERVCFVCTGNTCRSPMAAAVLNALGKGRYRAISAGTSVVFGDGIHPYSLAALEKAGIAPDKLQDYRTHRATQIDELIFECCDRVVCMTDAHVFVLREHFPKYKDKISRMICDIPDPYMYGQEVYDKCLSLITDAIKLMFAL